MGETTAQPVKPLQDLESIRDSLFTALDHIHNVNNSKETTKAYLEVLPKISKFETKLLQNVKLFKKIEGLKPNDREEQRVVDNSIKTLKLNGIDLPKEQKEELERIDLELEELSNQFSQNLIEAQKSYELLLEEADVAGIEKRLIITADEDGRMVEQFIDKNRTVMVSAGDYVHTGEKLTDGTVSSHDILATLGEKALYEYIVEEVHERL